MATVTGFTADRMLAIENASVVDGAVVGDDLILTRFDSSQINAGNVRGPVGPVGPAAAEQPTGMVTMFAGNSAPSGYVFCNGQAVSRTTYANLFSVIGTIYGSGNGSTTFNLPDFRNRMAAGLGDAGWSNSLGESGGDKDAIVVAHKHSQSSHSHSGPLHNHSGPNHRHTGGSHSHYTPSHFHTMPTHNHAGDNHDHSSNHDHSNVYTTIEDVASSTLEVMRGDGSGGLQVSVESGPSNIRWVNLNGTATEHRHLVNIPSYSGTTGNVRGGVGFTGYSGALNSSGSGSLNTSNGGAVNTSYSGTGNTGNAGSGQTSNAGGSDVHVSGESATNKNLPPYMTVNFIIKT